MIHFWRGAREAIRRIHASPLLQIVIWVILAVWFLRIWWGNPNTVRAIGTDSGSFLWEALYFSGLYFLIFSYSRTLSVRSGLKWFYLGMVGLTAAFALLHSWIYAAGPARGYHPLLGYWADKNGIYHTCIFSPLLSEGLKTVPLLIFLWIASRRKTLGSYSISDWALIGFLIGIGFHFAENAIRIQYSMYGFDFSWPKRTLDLILPIWRASSTFELFGRSFTEIGGSHGVQSGLIGLSVGLVLFLRRQGGPAAAWILPPLVILWTMADHALFNLSSHTNSPLLKMGWIRFLYLITLGGRLEVFSFGFGMFALAAFELRLLHRRWNLDHLKEIGRQVWFCAQIFGAMIAGTLSALGRGLSQPPKWLIPIRLPLMLSAGAWVGLEALLEHLNSQWALARVRHAVAWSQAALQIPKGRP